MGRKFWLWDTVFIIDKWGIDAKWKKPKPSKMKNRKINPLSHGKNSWEQKRNIDLAILGEETGNTLAALKWVGM